MKKLKKLNLNQLATEMHEIGEVDQSNYVGGSVFFDPSGNYLGTSGLGDDIQIISADEFIHNQTYGLSSSGVAISSSSSGTQWAVVNHYLSGSGSSGSGFLMNNVQIASPTIDAEAGFTTDGDFYIKSGSYVLDNESDLINTLAHEENHYINNFDGSATGEINAINAQIAHASYSTTSSYYKGEVADYLYDQWERQGIANDPGYTLADARTHCGL